MSKPVIEVQIRGLCATSVGCAVFLGNEEKVFVMFVDQSVGAAIAMFNQGTQKVRPLTHNLLANVLRALGAKVERVIIVAIQSLGRASISMIFFCCSSFSELRTSLAK